MTGELPYKINDCDNHFNEPPNMYERYIDPDKQDLAIRSVMDPSGREIQLFGGKPSRFTTTQVVSPTTALVVSPGGHRAHVDAMTALLVLTELPDDAGADRM